MTSNGIGVAFHMTPTAKVSSNTIKATADSTIADPSVVIELNELRKKLDKRETDIVRKDKEIVDYYNQNHRLHKELSVISVEVESLKERNEQLQQALISTRLAAEQQYQDSSGNNSKVKIKALENALKQLSAKNSSTEEDLAKSIRTNKKLQFELQSNTETLNEYIVNEKYIKMEMEEMVKNTAALTKRNEGLKNDLTNLQDDLAKSNNEKQELKKNIEKFEDKISDLINKEKVSQADVKKLVNTLAIRNETNQLLRNQIDEVQNSRHVLTKEEFNSLKRSAEDNVFLQKRVTDLMQSMDFRLKAQRKAEDDAKGLNNTVEDLKSQIENLLQDIERLRGSSSEEQNILNNANREISKLRRETKELNETVRQLEDHPPPDESELAKVKQELASVKEKNQEELLARQGERKRRQLAENSVRALKNRISFLFEQIESISGLSVSWEEQKKIMQSEISSLHNANMEFRKQIMDFYNQNSGMNNFDEAGFHDSNVEVDEDGLKSLIERALFDSSCAFFSGKKAFNSSKKALNKSSSANSKRPGNNRNLEGEFKAVNTEDGNLAIKFVGNETLTNVESLNTEDLLNSLQIPAFLKFVQHKQSAKAVELLVDKVSYILNFHYKSIHEYINQLGESRINTARAIAQNAINEKSASQAYILLSKERIAKQKAAIKYVREQLRHSDMSTLLMESNEVCKQAMAKDSNNESLIEIGSKISSLCDELRTINAPSGTQTGPVGAIELRLPDCQMDDETIHGIIGLLDGSMSSKIGDLDAINKSELINTIIKPFDLDETDKILPKLSLGQYFSKILLLNLKGNHLTDISCKILSRLIESSHELRMLDLRENYISSEGKTVLFEAARRNTSILYIIQKQDGSTIEGHREIVGGGITSNNESKLESRLELEKFINSAKFPLRIDIRHNSDSNILENQIRALNAVNNSRIDNSERLLSDQNMKVTAAFGRTISAKSSNEVTSININDDRDRYLNQSNKTGGFEADYQPYSHSDSDDDKTEDKDSRFLANLANRMKIPSNSSDVGKLLDQQIRNIEESAAEKRIKTSSSSTRVGTESGVGATRTPSSFSPSKQVQSPPKMSVMKRLMTQTKSVYENSFPKLQENRDENNNIDVFKYSTSHRNNQTRPKSASHNLNLDDITALRVNRSDGVNTAIQKGGANSVRDKLNSAKQHAAAKPYWADQNGIVASPYNNTATNVTNRTGHISDQVEATHEAHTLLSNLHKLNPSMLF